jgi:hypothetical protein
VERLVVIPESLTHDLPRDEVERVHAMNGPDMPILQIDACGLLWFGADRRATLIPTAAGRQRLVTEVDRDATLS